MTFSAKDMIRKRKSVRTFTGEPLKNEDRAAIEKAMDVQNDEVLPVASPIQKVDVGIALAHFDLTMQENGHNGQFVEADPGIALPENVQYIISYKREK